MTAEALDALERFLVAEERRLERRVGEARSVAIEGKAVSEEVRALQARTEALEEAIGVLQGFADERQAELQAKVEGIVTHGLKTIFGDDMSFHIRTTTRGKLTASEFVVRSGGEERPVETPIMDARGGGVAAVTGFLLRLIILLLKPEARPVLFLDESFAQLSVEYEPRLAEFMRELVQRTRVQIVLVTHSDGYGDVADRTYRMRVEDGITKVVAE